ncbi:hypothetical protein T492DRAFT_891379, partial [Pavlovales sp. CCMP2436]
PSKRKDPSTDPSLGGASQLAKQRLPVNMHPYGAAAKLIADKPPFWTIDNFLSKEECQGLISASEGLLDKSKTHAAPNGGVVSSGERTSYTCHLDKQAAECRPFLSK